MGVSRKAASPMNVTLAGIVIEVSSVNAKANLSMVANRLFPSNVREAISDNTKAESPMDVTLAGMVTDERLVSEKELAPIDVRTLMPSKATEVIPDCANA
jgi:hypothetical protein